MKPFDIIKPSSAGIKPSSAGIKPSSAGATNTKPAEPVRLDLDDDSAGNGATSSASPFGPYLLSRDLATSINTALALDQPLLITGEPGCGKTALAWAAAEQLGTEVLEFHVKSTSTARDLLYTFDNLRRFHDASASVADARDAGNYITYQALGRAIQSAQTLVVLIDEIDKAPRDFPNDLLNELDRMEFTVPELLPAPRFAQKVQHFVLITSNSERRLPMPFLRRCVYAHLDFPDAAMLENIVALHAPTPSTSFVSLAVKRFLELRAIDGMVKPPATSELIGWVRVLHRMQVDDATLQRPLPELPALESLVKMLEDMKEVRRHTA